MTDYMKEAKLELLNILRKYANGEARGDGLCTFVVLEASYERKSFVCELLATKIKRWSQNRHRGSPDYSVTYPFCPDEYDISGERGNYFAAECASKQCHLNQLRMGFVRDLIVALEEELAERASTDA